jgi:hypothetical protein
MHSPSQFHLKVWLVEQTCVFELSWGLGQHLTARLTYPQTLANFYQAWRHTYLQFYNSGLRARSQWSGVIAAPAVDWRAQLVQAEAQLLSEFHYWLNSADLLAIRRELARAAQQESENAVVDVFLTCDCPDLARLPWETWEIATEFAVANPIRIVRTPATIRNQAQPPRQRGKMRMLAILGDDSGLNFQADRQAVRSLSKVVEIQFVGWQQGQSEADLKQQIQRAIADPQGWDILFFAGHSNETNLTGGELAIAPQQSILVSEIAPQLVQAREQGLQFAIFNSCNGLSIAQTLIDLGLSQVAVMREPIHNRVAQEFLIHFLQSMAAYQDVHAALLSACQQLKLERNLTYPSAYLIPSLFRHPNAAPFRLQPFGWRQRLRQWTPTQPEAIALMVLLLLGWLPPLQSWLLEQRVWLQAVYRQQTGQVDRTARPPILVVQVDDDSIRRDQIKQVNPMDRAYLARLVDQLAHLDARVIGIDFLLDRHTNADDRLRQSLETAVRQRGVWLVFAARQKEGQWISVLPDLARTTWSLQGDMWLPYWYVRPLPWSDRTPPSLSYWLATAQRLQQSHLPPAAAALPKPPQPQLNSSESLANQVKQYLDQLPGGQPFVSQAMRLQPITALSYLVRHRWLQPILDFSIPPHQVYATIPAWQLLAQPDTGLQTHHLASLQQTIVILAPGGYDEAGILTSGEDNLPVPTALAYWRQQLNLTDQQRGFTGGEAHAYMAHHFLNQRLVIPIPDLWLIGLAAVLGKALSLRWRSDHPQRWRLFLVGGTMGYGLISLQAYLSAAILLPWLLPTLTLWIYVLPHWRSKDDA